VGFAGHSRAFPSLSAEPGESSAGIDESYFVLVGNIGIGGAAV
jgi:hypothetical protein